MDVTTEREESIFDAALQLAEPAEREAFLDRECAGNPELRSRMDKLLTAHSRAERFFTECVSGLAVLPDDPQSAPQDALEASADAAGSAFAEEQLGTRIRDYKLLQKIGEGGCGIVYMAEQEKPVRRRVALKIIKLGMDTRAVISRFEAERQALAMMDHPNIARVLDAGATETGRPYFVMELVHGIRITDYCDQNHLDTNQRLDLFIQICHAIQHAHQKGIIHRDIKPSNILVTLHDGVPVPKVIDFGIAKATGARLTEKTLFTMYGHFIGTPAYMSPEQAEMSGLDVDTRSDIYSLGVLLYELLTGKTPFGTDELLESGVDEMRRTLREREPHRPSTKLDTMAGLELTKTAEHRRVEPPRLKSLLKGDLDWIVMKALEKDRSRRYETANGLAMDIQRHLDNEPVLARPPSRVYRFRKLVQRNRGVFIAGGAVAAALMIGLGTSTILFLKEREARQRAVEAEQQQAKLRQASETREKITQATILVNQDKLEEADALVSRMVFTRANVEGAAVLRAVGEWHALHQRWRLAADRFTTLLQVNQLDGWDLETLDYLECGPALIEVGDLSEYDRFRRAAIARFNGTTHPVTDRIVKISLLLPADRAMVRTLVPLTDVLAGSITNAETDVFRAAWQSVSLALLEYRRGDYPEAVRWAQQCLTYTEFNAPRSATARVILAMAYHRLGRDEEAQSELAQGRETIEGKFKTGLDRGTGIRGFWFDWIFARILLREATQVVEKP